VQWRGGSRSRLPSERTQVRISPRTVVFAANATVICSLGHGLCTFTAVPRSTQPCIPPGSLNRASAQLYPSFGWSKGGNFTSVGWQVTLCDPIWHVCSGSGVAMLHCEQRSQHVITTSLVLHVTSKMGGGSVTTRKDIGYL